MFKRSVFSLVTTAALFAGANHAVAQVSVAERLAPEQPPVVAAAGRAMGTGYPDDSLARFQWAIDRGIDILVVSVQMTGDGHYIVFYDGTLTRTTNVREVYPDGAPRRDPGDTVARWHLVADYTLEEIRRLRLIDPQGGDHPVPTLNEVLDLIDGKVLTVLNPQGFNVDSLAAQLEGRDSKHLLFFNEGDLPKLEAITTATGIGAWSTVTEARDATVALEALADRFGTSLKVVDVEHDQLTSDLVARATQLGVRLCHRGMGLEDNALIAGDTKPWLEALDGPATIFITRHPDAVLNLLGR